MKHSDFFFFFSQNKKILFLEILWICEICSDSTAISKSFPAGTSVISIALFLPFFVANKTSSYLFKLQLVKQKTIPDYSVATAETLIQSCFLYPSHFKSSWAFQENAKHFSMLCLWKTASTLLFTGTNNISPFVSTQHLFYISTLSYWLFCDYIHSLVLPHSVDSFFCNMFWHTKWTYWISLYLVLQDSFSPQQLYVSDNTSPFLPPIV